MRVLAADWLGVRSGRKRMRSPRHREGPPGRQADIVGLSKIPDLRLQGAAFSCYSREKGDRSRIAPSY